MRDKAQVFNIFQKHTARTERLIGKKLIAIRIDNGSEFKNSNFDKCCGINCVTHEFTNSFNPEENGLCGRANQTI